jgi:hypothetical protein
MLHIEMISDGSLIEFECAISNDKHFINKAINLSCGHNICEECIPIIKKNIECNICKKVTEDLSKTCENYFFKMAFQSRINTLFSIIEASFKKSLDLLKSIN